MSKGLRKILSVVLALMLTLTGALNVGAAEYSQANIDEAEAMGLVPEYLLTDYGLNDEITRVQFVELLWLLLLNFNEQIYIDTADIDYDNTNAYADTYNYAIDDLFEIGVLPDTSKFYPEERLKREDAALWTARTAKYMGITELEPEIILSDGELDAVDYPV